ncbi:MAG: MBOAT family protein [Fluviicola sp. XM-24bin1]|nr:MAG: MBOAT family protein [Fluviicola sp. XM-24bin1]
MNLLLTTDWQFGELFTRFSTIFSWHVGEGSSLVFTKLDFWLFFLLVMAVFSFLNKHILTRSIFLTIISLFFFYKTSGLYMLLLIISVAVNYFLGARIYKTEKSINKKWIIAISAIFNLLILGYFKYAYFFTDSFNQMFGTSHELVNHFAQFGNGFFGEGTFVEKILLPVGVSFFTFQNISYVVDIYRKEIEPVKNFFHYSFFVTFFPQLVMGPIVRARDFIPQISKPFSLNKQEFSWSIIQIVKGLVKKIVIADFLVVHFIDKILFTETFTFDTYPGFVFVIVMWAYSIHIYADFSGYTDIAIGLSRLMGFELKPNFNSPYKAISVADFWRRWHISLGSWLKDYLYIPLGGNRTGTLGSYIAIFIIFVFLIFITQWYDLLWVYLGVTVVYVIGLFTIKNFKRYVHRDLNLIITMVVGGLWHGASENFVIWGAMNGCALLIFKYWKRINEYLTSKSALWYLSKGFIAYAIYCILLVNFPWLDHIAIHYVYYAWMASATLMLIIHFVTRQAQSFGFFKNIYVRFWQIFVTFNFITFTRIWFKLDEARKGPFKEKGLEDATADLLPGKLLDRIWNNFEFSMEYFWKFWDLFYVPILIMIAGFIMHWLPNKVKKLYEDAYTWMPVPVQAICIAIIVFLMYQAIGAEQPPFVYLQF